MLRAEADKISTELGVVTGPAIELEARLGDLLGKSDAPEDELDLLRLVAKARIFKLPSGWNVFSVDFPEAEFRGSRFTDVFNQARSNPLDEPAGVLDTVNDWRLPDLTNVSDYYSRQHAAHSRGMPKAYRDFVRNDRLKYIDVANPLVLSAIFDFFNSRDQWLVTKYAASEMMDEAQKNCFIPGARVQLAYVGDINSENWVDLDVSIPFESFPQDLKDTIIGSARREVARYLKIVDPNEPAGVLQEGISKDNYHQPFAITHLGGGIVEKKYAQSVLLVDYKGKEPEVLAISIEGINDEYATPKQVWAVSNQGERFWLDGFNLGSLTKGVDPRSNLRFGFALAAVMSNEKNQFPSQLSLEAGGIEQPLKGAQMAAFLYLTNEEIRRMVSEDDPRATLDPHKLILNGSYFRNLEAGILVAA